RRAPSLRLVLVTSASTLLYFGLTVWGWGWDDWSGVFAHPARAGAFVATVVLSIAALFSGCSVTGGRREDRRNRWIFLPLLLISVGLGWLPPYTDRRNIASLDGDAVRYAGLAILLIGGLLRIGAVYALGWRFSGVVAIQEGHTLKTDGLYRVIRHPSYTGAILAMVGWALVFRSGMGVLLALLLIPLLVARMDAEE